MTARFEEEREQIRRKLEDRLEAGETLVVQDVAVPVAGARGVKLSVSGPARIGGLIGEALARRGAVGGDVGSMARSLPANGEAHILVLTERRLLLFAQDRGHPTSPAWEAPREALSRVDRLPRLQLLAKLRLRFADGSAAKFLVWSGRTTKQLQEELGSRNAR